MKFFFDLIKKFKNKKSEVILDGHDGGYFYKYKNS